MTTINRPHTAPEWLSRLVRIPSVNPAHAGPRAGEPGEGRLADALAGYFTELGGEVTVHEIYPGRPNVYATWPGRADRWVGVDTHMDTVGVEHMLGDPFDGRIEDGRVYGRGAVDTKASLGVILSLLEAMQNAGVRPEPNLLIAATVDEETGTKSAPLFAEWVQEKGLPLDELVVAEPTLCKPVYAHKGGIWTEFTVHGVASHSAQPHLGKNAIYAAARIVTAFEAEAARLAGQVQEPIGWTPTLNVAIIQADTGMNVVPDSCKVMVGRRLVPGEDIDTEAARLEEIARAASPLPVDMELRSSIRPFLQSPDTDWVRQLSAWSGEQTAAVPYGTNAWAYGDLPGECIVLGPGSIDQAHGEVEWVAVSELERLAGIYMRWWGVG